MTNDKGEYFDFKLPGYAGAEVLNQCQNCGKLFDAYGGPCL